MPDRHIWLVVACALLAVTYVLPSLIGVVRHGADASRLVAINLVLGWTVIGWVWALVLAYRAPNIPPSPATPEWTPWFAGRPEAVEAVRPVPNCYAEGTFLISDRGTARTWAVCRAGRWGIAYELDGTQRMGAWVDSTDIPVDVLAHALCRHTEDRA